MDEPLLGAGRMVVDVDLPSRLATVRARLPGPAGTAAIDLGGAIDLDIDVADPASLAGLTIELPLAGDAGRLPRGVSRRLDVLLGTDCTAQVAAAARASAHAGGGDGPQSLAGRRGAGVAPALQRAALAHASAYDAGAPRLVRSVGMLEAAVALDPLTSYGLLDLRAAAQRDAYAGAGLLAELAARAPLALPDSRVATALAALLRRVHRLLDGGDASSRTLAALAVEIERGDHTDGAASAAPGPLVAVEAPEAEPAVPTAAGLPRRTPVDVHALPGALSDAAVSARRSAPAEVEVRVDGWADRRHGLWARAFDAADDTLVGLAPFRRDPATPADAVAHVVVPPDTGAPSGHPSGRRYEVDVTDRPEMPRPSPTLALVERARYEGTRAARAARLGDRAPARHRWLTCARLWAVAGDSARAGQARARAGGGPGPGIGPLVCDLVYAG